MAVLPEEIPTGTLKGQFYFVNEDNIDADTKPELTVVKGFVRCVASVKTLRMASKKAIVIPLRFDAEFDGQGNLKPVNGNSVGMELPAVDSPLFDTTGWTWTATFELVEVETGFTVNLAPVTFQIFEGKETDLSEIIPVEASPGIVTTRGLKGDKGDPGLDGSNVLPTNQAIAQAIETEGETKTALSSAIDGSVTPLKADRGRRFMAKMLAKQRDAVLGFAGDSLGNETTEYAYMTTQWLAKQFPNAQVIVHRDPTESGSYATTETIQTGYRTTPRPPRFVEDTFTYTATELVGTKPSKAGSEWGSNGTDALGDWTASGSGAVATNNLPTGAILCPTGSNSDHLIEATFIPNAVTNLTGDSTTTFHLRFVSLSTGIQLRIIRHAGGVTFTARLAKNIGGVLTTIAEFTSSIPTSGVYNIEARAGGYTYAVVNGRRLEGGQLAAGDQATLTKTGGANVGFSKGGASNAGDKITRFWAGLPGTARQQILTVYIGCRASQILQYQQDRLATLYPQALDLLSVCSSHNYGGNTDSTYIRYVESFTDSVLAAQPGTGFVFASQNPEREPTESSVMAQHRNRCIALAEWTDRRNYGYIPVYEAFVKRESEWDDLIDSDGVHPTKGPDGTGSALMRDEYTKYLSQYLLA